MEVHGLRITVTNVEDKRIVQAVIEKLPQEEENGKKENNEKES